MSTWCTAFLDRLSLNRLVWGAPLIFLLHVVEEAPCFVVWINSLVSGYITDQAFIVVNASGFVITLLVSIAVARSKDGLVVLVALAWFSFVMFANAVLHITATAVHGLYSPGVITSIVLYLPFYLWFVSLVARRTAFRTAAIASSVVVGALPMLLHGYFIIFEGRLVFQA